MERYSRVLGRVVTLLGRGGYVEGSYTDLQVQRLIKIYSHTQSRVLDHHGEEKLTGEYITAGPITSGDTGSNPIVAPLAN